MLDEERKAIARRAHDAINQKNVELLDGHPGYRQTR
jgi:signal transduction histidine kinase